MKIKQIHGKTLNQREVASVNAEEFRVSDLTTAFSEFRNEYLTDFVHLNINCTSDFAISINFESFIYAISHLISCKSPDSVLNINIKTDTSTLFIEFVGVYNLVEVSDLISVIKHFRQSGFYVMGDSGSLTVSVKNCGKLDTSLYNKTANTIRSQIQNLFFE